MGHRDGDAASDHACLLLAADGEYRGLPDYTRRTALPIPGRHPPLDRGQAEYHTHHALHGQHASDLRDAGAVANETKQQTIALARGTARQRFQQAQAAASVIEQSVSAEMFAYGNVSQTVNLNVSEGLSYIWWSAQIDTQGKEFYVGLDPNAVIRSRV